MTATSSSTAQAVSLRVALSLAVLLVAVACSDDDSEPVDGGPSSAVPAATEAAPSTREATEPTRSDPTSAETSPTSPAVSAVSAVSATDATDAATTVPAGFAFTSPEGDYSIVFPGEPSPLEQQVPLPDGTSMATTLHVYDAGEFAAGTGRSTLPAGVVPSLEGARDGAMATFPGAALSSSEPLKLQGRDGLQFVADLDPGGPDASYIARVYVDGQDLYQVFYVGGDIAATDPDVTAFFDSFRFSEG